MRDKLMGQMMERLLVIQLNEGDMAELIMLVASEGLTGTHHAQYWQKLVDKIRSQVNQQLSGQFFQCAACTEENFKVSPKVV